MEFAIVIIPTLCVLSASKTSSSLNVSLFFFWVIFHVTHGILFYRIGTSEEPRSTSRRCIILLILLFGFFMFQFYSASIVGSLLMEKPKTIKTLRGLIDSPLKIGIEDIVYNKDFFRVSIIPTQHGRTYHAINCM